jgi:gas vesicle protein
MSRDSSTGTVLTAFLLGALAGAAVALLYAPAPGEETRRKLAEKAREGRRRAEGAVREAIDRGVEAFEQVRKETL